MPEQQERLIELLRDVNRGISRYVKDVFTDHDIPVAVMIATRQIAREPGITISELARQTGIAKSHISNTIADLEQRGWVEKKADHDDQRIFRLYLTPSASENLEIISLDIRRKLSVLVADIPDERAAELIASLRDIKEALSKAQTNQAKPQISAKGD
ncbi:MAG: MarR family winged helix-turn-helix transcriptional regulator [Acidobacteriota bacterium]